MLAVLASLIVSPLLYLPGFCIAYAFLGDKQPPDLLERCYERVVAGALLNGWVALLLAELGIFTLGLHLLVIAGICLACVVVIWRRGMLRWPQSPLGIVAWHNQSAGMPASMQRWAAANLDIVLFAAVGIMFAVLVARPFEVVLGARDAGVYATSGFAIARTGGIVQSDQVLRQIATDQQSDDPQLSAAAQQAETNLLGTQDAERFVATRLRFAGFLINNGDLAQGRVVPQFFHLYPAWIALLASLLGLRGGLLATSLLGLLGVWGVGMLGRRLAGRWVGLLGMLFLALNGVQVWFSRYSTSEACAQFLSFAALYGFAAMHDRGPRTEDRGPTRDAPVAEELTTHNSQLTSHSWFGGLLAGVAAGQLALARIDFFPIVAPLLLYLGYLVLTKRWNSSLWALSASLGAMLVHALIHIITISRAYFVDTLFARLQDQSAILATLTLPLLNPTLREIFYGTSRSVLKQTWRLPLELALVAVLIVAFALLRRDGRPQHWIERTVVHIRAPLLGLGTAIILLLGVYGYLIRPQILTLARLAAAPRCILPGPARSSPDCLALQGYVGAPIVVPTYPNAVGYALQVLPKIARFEQPPPVVRSLPATTNADLRDLPSNGNLIGQVSAGDTLQLRAGSEADAALLVIAPSGERGWVDSQQLVLRSPKLATLPQADGSAAQVSLGATSPLTGTLASAATLVDEPLGGAVRGRITPGAVVQVVARSVTRRAYLVTSAYGVTGWLPPATLGPIVQQLSDLPKAAAGVLANLTNPRVATPFSFGNSGESEKIGIAQANLVRVGWYLSPLGVLLGIIGFALWWRRGLNAASWLFLAASLISAVFFVRLSYGASDLTYIYILRRYLPLVYPAFGLGMAYAIVALAGWKSRELRTKNHSRPTVTAGSWFLAFGSGRFARLGATALVLAQLAFFVATNRQLYRHVEYGGALEQLGALAQNFTPDDVLLFRGEGRDTPDLVATPLQYGFGLNAFTIRSSDPGKYAQQLARYVQHWRDQGRRVFLVLGANGAVELPGLRPVRVGPAALRLPEFQQLRDQKPSLAQEFAFDFMIYRLEPADTAQPPSAIAVDDYAAQVRGFYHPEQIGGATVAWTGGEAMLRLPWPRGNAPFELSVDLAPGAARPASLGPARACLSYRPEASLALDDAPFASEQCIELSAGMHAYRYRIDPRGHATPATGTFLLRITGPTWVPAAVDPAQHDQRTLGVQFGGVR